MLVRLNIRSKSEVGYDMRRRMKSWKRLGRDKRIESQIESLRNEDHQPYRQKAEDKSDIVFLFWHSN